MGYRVHGLDPRQFDHLRGLSNIDLAAIHAERVIADAENSYPCRISLADANIGDSLILVNFEHQPTPSPYRSSHAIFINESSREQVFFDDELPAALQRRLLSIRAFDAQGHMHDADIVNGVEADSLVRQMLSARKTAYLHVHYAKRGCFAACIDRLEPISA